jgi:hypothetical protein
VKERSILAELRAWRDNLAREHEYDLSAMAAKLRELDAAAGTRVVHGEPRRPTAATKGTS